MDFPNCLTGVGFGWDRFGMFLFFFHVLEMVVICSYTPEAQMWNILWREYERISREKP